jgi:MFS family permease
LQCDALFSHLNHLYLTALLPSNRIEPRQYSKTITTMLLRYLPFAPSTTPLQALTYLLGISLFSISFLVFLNSSISFVITDLIGQKEGVGDVVGTLGFADELVALVACPGWGLVSDRLGVRWVAVIGYAIIGLSLALFVQATNVYPQLLLARVLFAVGASAAATMVTAILPSLTDDSNSEEDEARARIKALQNATARSSIAFSVESEATITQERYTQSVSERSMSDSADSAAGRPSKLAGFVGLFTGCGALVALTLFLPLPAKFGEDEDTTPAEAVSYSFYVVAVVAFAVSLFVAIGLRNIKGEEGKGFRVLFGLKDENESASRSDGNGHQQRKLAPYLHLMKDSVFLGFVDSRIGLGYVGGFVARASSVAISLFIPLFVNTYYISNGFCKGSPHDSSPELKEECKAAYVLSSILTGVAQFMGLICAPVFGYLASRTGRINYPIVVSTVFGIVGYTVLPQLASPEIKDVDGRGGSPIIFLVVSLLGISQIGAIVCSLGSLGRGVLAVELPRTTRPESLLQPEDYESANDESRPLISITTDKESISRIRLKGSIAGVYSLYGGFAILLLTKLGGYLFDTLSNGAPFYMMAIFNAVLLAFSLGMDASRTFSSQA